MIGDVVLLNALAAAAVDAEFAAKTMRTLVEGERSQLARTVNSNATAIENAALAAQAAIHRDEE